jgi:ribonuclease HI
MRGVFVNAVQLLPLRAVAYVDGGCSPNPGRAGWAAVVITPTGTRELWGTEERSTNQRAELLAAIAALEVLDEPTAVEIVSDSMYLVMCGRGEWRRKANLDLWARLTKVAVYHDVTYTWVRGHAGNPGNERAHELAMCAISGEDIGGAA